jgi:hypothetical protein
MVQGELKESSVPVHEIPEELQKYIDDDELQVVGRLLE